MCRCIEHTIRGVFPVRITAEEGGLALLVALVPTASLG